jgi:hypothetical protein
VAVARASGSGGCKGVGSDSCEGIVGGEGIVSGKGGGDGEGEGSGSRGRGHGNDVGSSDGSCGGSFGG